MARTRQITADDILDAAERVVIRDGAARLSIDAVAKEAGVSKSRVVYDHKTKSQLIDALVGRRIEMDRVRTEACVAASSDTPHPELFGRIASAVDGLDDADRAIALVISASMSSEETIQQRMRDWVQADLAAISTGEKPQAALMAYLALTGFFCMELFDFHRWSDEERKAILDDIGNLYRLSPQA